MSREMSRRDRQFEKKFGYKPTAIRTSYYALAPNVNRTTARHDHLVQSGPAFQDAQSGGPKASALGDLGATGEWATRPLSLYGRNSPAALRFFKDHVLQTATTRTREEQPARLRRPASPTTGTGGLQGHRLPTSGSAPGPAEKEAASSRRASADVMSANTALAFPLHLREHGAG